MGRANSYWGNNKRTKVFLTKEQAILQRFWSYINIEDENACWLWNTTPNGSGYGDIYVNGKLVQAHRFMWELVYGPIPPKLCVCHSCDVRICVNPEHLFLGTKKDNAQDALRKGRLYSPGFGRKPTAP